MKLAAHRTLFLISGAFIALLLLILNTNELQPKVIHAMVPCYTIVTPTSIGKNSEGTFTFTVENNDSSMTIRWIDIITPSGKNANFTITNGSAAGWTADVTDHLLIFRGGTIEPSQSASFTVTMSTGSDEGTTIMAIDSSENEDGQDAGGCDGALAVTTLAQPTVSITNLQFTSVSDTQATVTFSTNIAATSQLRYGTTTGYGTTKTIDGATTSHSYTITDLSANTTYHYQITATDGNSTGSTSDSTFTTASTGGVTIMPTQVPTATVQPTATPTPTPDTKPPQVNVQKPPPNAQTKVPLVKGAAADNVAVTMIEYSLNKGKQWNAVKTTKNLGTKLATYEFTPPQNTSGTYDIMVRAKDAAGNIGIGNTVSFTIDVTGPTLNLITPLTKPYRQSPTLEGTATDPSGIDSIEYSIDNGKNWQAVDTVHEVNTTTQQYAFTPAVVDDGNYPIQIRTKDTLGNPTSIGSKTLIIDRLPPRIGGTILSLGPQILTPQPGGAYTTIPNAVHSLTTSFVGGPNSVVLTMTSKTDPTPMTFPLSAQPSSTRWSTDLTFTKPGDYSLVIRASDGAGNILQKNLPPVHVMESGTVSGVNDRAIVKVTVMTKDQTSGQFRAWDGNAYGQTNPTILFTTHAFSFFLPSGTYYFDVSSFGYKRLKSTQFTLVNPTPVSPAFVLRPQPSLSLLGFTFALPMFDFTTQAIDATQTTTVTRLSFPDKIQINQLPSPVDETIDLPSIPGTKVLLTILNTWAPQAPSQLHALQKIKQENPDMPIVIVVPHETPSGVALFVKRGGYTLPFLADPNGDFLEKIPYVTVPTHHIIDKSGTIAQSFSGVIQSLSDIGW